ncbi:SOS response-associated peptidase [Phytoactinopolyspora halotolerans]|uniref:Abasic site processing protein n=1 Tax=Phytoactinopolyspora halotolerans TaxID=1981512 RepID=A0A6L9S7L7_9ACTN|nr:SOS response-associated peptidase [Phytoactinopolyspora halotolerans]NEE01156.1 SOS response-associated peptidase [Phytoactinopolyspora halotolerans]
MCGRYVVAMSVDDMLEEFDAVAGDTRDLAPSYNVAPTDRVPIVVEPSGGASTRELHAARWGLIPPWSTDLSGAAKMINARVETVAEKPAYRAAIARRRCIVPASGYYEWQRLPDGRKQPFYIHPPQRPLVMAGVFEWRRDPRLPAEDVDRWVLSTSILTTRLAADLAHIHDRMPVLSPEHASAWLDRTDEDTAALTDLVVGTTASVAEALAPRPVGAAVGNVRINHPGLIEPFAGVVTGVR